MSLLALTSAFTLTIPIFQTAPNIDQITAQLKRVGSQIEQAAKVKDVTFQRDAARFTFGDGSLYLLGPVGDRRVAMVFVGRGAIDLVPPLSVERSELRRLMGDSTLSGPFTSAVFVFADSTAEELGRRVTFTPIAQAADDPASRRQVPSRVDEGLDWVISDGKQMPSGFLSAILNKAPNEYFSAYLTRPGKDNILLSLDPFDAEGLSVDRKGKHPGQKTQSVIQFPRIADLGDTTGWLPLREAIEIRGYEIESTIKENLAYSGNALIKIAPRAAGQRWVQFYLSPFLDVDSLTNGTGQPLRYLRPNNQYSLWIELDSTARVGAETSVRVAYHGGILAPGSLARQFMPKPSIQESASQPPINDRWVFLKETWAWFPRHGGEATNFKLTFRTPVNFKLASIGRLVERNVVGKAVISRWESEAPARNVSFNVGEFEEHKITDPRIPPVTVQINAEAHRQLSAAFLGQRDPAVQVGSDVANSLSFFSRVFGDPLFSHYYATEIPYGHGEAFPGLIHLSWWTFQTLEDKGESEVFRAHEMAHQWWGIGVQPKRYRDRWLAEGFSDFSGLWYMQLILRDNEKYFKKLAESRKRILALKDAPALGVGTRVGAVNPMAYSTIVYDKGAWILQMIRNMAINLKTMKEDVFEAAMADFYTTYRGKKASTEDFRAVMEKHMGVGLGWFFRQWFEETSYPTYVLSWRAETGSDGKPLLKVKVRQEGVPDDFFMPVPLKIIYADGSSVMIRVVVKGKETIGELGLPSVPVRLELNPLESVLATVKDEDWKPASPAK